MAYHASLALAIALMFSTHTILNDEYDAYRCWFLYVVSQITSNNTVSGAHKTNTAELVGGIVGGVVATIILISVTILLVRHLRWAECIINFAWDTNFLKICLCDL